jgi:thiosulfate/3-mercaptopyruvate sulfurtransferase
VSAVLITPGELKDLLDGPEPPTLLDVRWALGDPHGRDHYRKGHIPGAVYVDLDTELSDPPSAAAGRHPLPGAGSLQGHARRWGVTSGRTVVVYDDSGGLAAARAWWLLRWGGVADVRLLDGALASWGYELTSGDESNPLGNIEIVPGGLPVLTADEAAGLARTGTLLDARAAGRYRGETEPIDARAGHIPGAVSAPTGDNLTAAGVFRTAAELSARFAALGVRGGTRLGVYCGSGVTAAHQIAALAIAGFDAALFPGSWSAWSADQARPVAVGGRP